MSIQDAEINKAMIDATGFNICVKLVLHQKYPETV